MKYMIDFCAWGSGSVFVEAETEQEAMCMFEHCYTGNNDYYWIERRLGPITWNDSDIDWENPVAIEEEK